MKKHNLNLPVLRFLSNPTTTTSDCPENDKDFVATSGGDMDTGADLRVVHASPNAPAVDVYAKGAAAPVVFKAQIAEAQGNLESPTGSRGNGARIEQGVTIRMAAGSSGTSTVAPDAGGTMPELFDDASISALSPAVQVPPAIPATDVGVGGGQPGATVLPHAEMFEDVASPRYRVVHVSPGFIRDDVGLWDGMFEAPVSVFNDLDFGESTSDTTSGLA